MSNVLFFKTKITEPTMSDPLVLEAYAKADDWLDTIGDMNATDKHVTVSLRDAYVQGLLQGREDATLEAMELAMKAGY